MRPLIVIGTVGSDVHSVANTLLEKALIDSGFQVENLGVAVPEIEWLETIISLQPDLALIGSMNGDLIPLNHLIKSLTSLISPWKIIVGGKLNLGSDGSSNAPLLKAMGVCVIEDDEVSFEEIIEFCIKILHSEEFLGHELTRDAN